MNLLPLSWHTDLAVLTATGSAVEEHADHLVVRTPANPAYHWGNFLLVTDPAAVDDAARWEAVFATCFPDAAHRAVGLVADPATPRPGRRWGCRSSTRTCWSATRRWSAGRCPRGTPSGRSPPTTTGSSRWGCAIGDLTAEQRAEPGRTAYELGSTAARRRLVGTGNAVWLGAFAGDELAADQGILDCGEGVARYQDVITKAAHRRRGLTSHLLGEASAWAADRGCRTWVILADADEAPSRLYQGLGFLPGPPSSQAYRAPRG